MCHRYCYNDRTPPVMMLYSDGYKDCCNENIYFNGILMGNEHVQWPFNMFTWQWEHILAMFFRYAIVFLMGIQRLAIID